MSTADVDLWMAAYDNPMKPVVQRVREIILAADPRMRECIKWSAPTFTYKGNLASFFPKAKKHASLMFHSGASIPGEFPNLVGTGDVARQMTFPDLATAEARRAELEEIVQMWCALRDG